MDIAKRKRIPTNIADVEGSCTANVTFITWKVTIKDKFEREHVYDFSPFAEKRPALARHFMDAFYGQHIVHETCKAYIYAIKIFWRFLEHLESRDNHITTLDQIDTGLIEIYIDWLRQDRSNIGESWNPNTQRRYYSYVTKLLQWLLINRYADCCADLMFSRDVFVQTSRHSTPREAYSKDELAQIIKAIEAELEEVSLKLENKYVRKDVGSDPRVYYRAKNSPWRSWNNVVWYFENKLHCKSRTQSWLSHNGHSCFSIAAYQHHGGLLAVWSKLGIGSKQGKNIVKGIGVDPTVPFVGARVFWKEWDNIVWYFENVLEAEYKSHNWLRENGHYAFENAVHKYHGGLDAVWERLGVWNSTAKQALTPFLLLFSIVTGANKTPILEMKRDCIKEDALLGRKYVIWFKNRGDSIHRSWSPVARMIIERVIQLTEPFVPSAGMDKPYLWLFKNTGRGRKGIKRINLLCAHEFAWFVAKYNLTDDDGNPLSLTIARFRPTFASRAFELCNGDIVKLRTLLNHVEIKTTQRYVRNFEKEKEDARAFCGMTNILEAIKSENLITRYSEEIKATREEVLMQLAGHKFFTGLGNCLDPYRSPLKGEQPLKRCRRFWSCLTCRHILVLDVDLPEIISHYNHVASFKNHLTSGAFEKTYGYILSIIDNDILPRFDKATVEWARKKAVTYPAASIDLHMMCLEESLKS